MHQDESLHIFTKIFNKVGKHWQRFLDQIKKAADIDDESQIYFNKFLMILDKYGVRLNSEEREQLL